MRRITEVEAHGLWSHLDSSFKFAPGLTVVVGPNDSGKSSLLRVIRWIALGIPEGESFIFRLEDESGKVIQESKEGFGVVKFDDGKVVTKTRKRGGRTTYEIYQGHDLLQEFVMSSVPLEVQELFGIKESKFGDFETVLNFAFQLEAPFLLSESPSVGAKVLGTLAGTEVIDMALREFSKEKYSEIQERTAANKELERINGDLLKYEMLDSWKTSLDICSANMGKVEALIERKDKLCTLSIKYGSLSEVVLGYIAKLITLNTVDQLVLLLNAVSDNYAKARELDILETDYDKKQGWLSELWVRLREYKNTAGLSAYLTSVELLEKGLVNFVRLCKESEEKTAELHRLLGILSGLGNVYVLGEMISSVEKGFGQYQKLVGLDALAKARIKFISETEAQISSLSGLESCNENLNSASGKVEALKEFKKIIIEYKRAALLIPYYQRQVDLCEETMGDSNKELQEAWAEAGGVCPLCNQPLNVCQE